MAINLLALRIKVIKLAESIKAPVNSLPTFGDTEDFARPHIEVDNNGMHWIVVERGVERQRKSTRNEDQLLYWIFQSITHSMSSEYAAKNRVENESFRRTMFSHQLELLEKLNPMWRKQKEEEINKILKNSPYRD